MPTLDMILLQGTLPGFPPAPQPTGLQSFIVIVLIPLIIAAVIIIPGLGRAFAKRDDAAAPAAIDAETRKEIASH